MSHFVAVNTRYPQFSFNAKGLRPLFKKRVAAGDTEYENQSTLVRFHDGVLDTKVQGYTPQEAQAIREALNKCHATSVNITWGNDEEDAKVEILTKPLEVRVKGAS